MAVFFLVLLTILLIIALNACINTSFRHILVSSNCGKEYYVCKEYPDTQMAADMLCEINGRCNKLIWYLESLRVSPKEKKKVIKLKDEYDWDDLIEHPTEAYTIDKGRKIYLCLREKSTGRLHDINTVMFVVIHELSHIITETWDTTSNHSAEFWDNNVWLLKEAIKVGLYRPVDYSRFPVEYCGMHIDSSPLF